MMAEAFSSGVGSEVGVQEWVRSQVAGEEGGRQMDGFGLRTGGVRPVNSDQTQRVPKSVSVSDVSASSSRLVLTWWRGQGEPRWAGRLSGRVTGTRRPRERGTQNEGEQVAEMEASERSQYRIRLRFKVEAGMD